MVAERNRAGPENPSREKESAALAELPQLQAQVQQMMAEHFERWVSEKIAALDGQTPLGHDWPPHWWNTELGYAIAS